LSQGFQAGFGSDALLGKRSARVVVPAGNRQDWVGWRSGEIPVEPGASYLYAGFLKTRGVSGTVRLHAHTHNAEGRLTTTAAFHSTTPEAGPTADWTHSVGTIHTSPDTASVQLHLTMNATGTLQHDGILLCRVLPAETVGLEAPESGSPAATGLRAWSVNPLVKVFPDDLPGPAAHGVAVECARNEYEPIQLALRCPRAIPGIEVRVSPLRTASNRALPPVRVDHVGYVPVDHPSGYFRADVPAWYRMVPRGKGSTDGWAGEWPDPLIPGGRFDLAAQRTQAVWLTVYAPAAAAPGDYRGLVAIRAPGIRTQTIPLRVTVLPFALPQQTRLKAIFDLRAGPGGDFGSGLRTAEGQRRWLRFLAEHRLGTDRIPAEPVFSYQDGKVTMDAAAFDEMARYCFEELGMNVSYTPGFFYAFGWAHTPKRFFGLEPFTPEYNAAFQQAYRLFSEHIKARGWHNRFLYYISDEPHFAHPFVVEQMQRLCALAHEVDPSLPIYSSTWRHCPQWDDSLDVWGVGQYGCFPVEQMKRLQQRGKKMLFTCDGQMATDTPYLATERLLPYYCFKYDVIGFEFWGVSWWTYDPWERGWHTFIRQSNDGKEFYWTRYPNGDGYLTYPGARVGVQGPVSTIRLEQVREGLEDYEALALLSARAAAARRAGKPAAAAEHALALARNLVSIPNAGGLRSTEILPDPDRVPTVRRAVNAALAATER
ncbi:MAG: DUF4091 domain-containing protein, partial [Armatimonadota bacterium]|nr:DUF4091 domain-containing protein [Armatimonadota bacterium]